MSREERKAHFIRQLSEYLVGDQANKSIELQMQKPDALMWAKVRGATPLHGYPTVDEAEAILKEFLS
jgi:hypothetical protein